MAHSITKDHGRIPVEIFSRFVFKIEQINSAEVEVYISWVRKRCRMPLLSIQAFVKSPPSSKVTKQVRELWKITQELRKQCPRTLKIREINILGNEAAINTFIQLGFRAVSGFKFYYLSE